MADTLLAAYVFNHYNWQYEFLRPTVDAILMEYLKIHGKDVPEDEAEEEPEPEPEGDADEDGASDAGDEE